MNSFFRSHQQFDLNGNLVDWWQSQTKEHYLEKARCIIEQYGNYTEPTTGLKVSILFDLLSQCVLFPNIISFFEYCH